MTEKQKTLAGEASVEGVGLHSGAPAKLRLKPGLPDEGFVFIRTDLDGKRIAAGGGPGEARARRTTLIGEGGASVQTVEHLLSAFYGLGIDTAEIEIEGPEPPGLDGSAREYVEAIRSAGMVELDAPRRSIRPSKPIAVRSPKSSITAIPGEPGCGLSLTYTLDYTGLPAQYYAMKVEPEAYVNDIAGARTFCLKAEAEMLQQAGLGKGATFQNTLVVSEDGSVIENELRFPDEFVRHKVLDLIGDLAVMGAQLDAHVVAIRSGHDLNGQLVQELLADAETAGLAAAPANAPAPTAEGGLWDIQELLRVLPHRYPFLMLDRIVKFDLAERVIVGLKNVSINEPYFSGHFPKRPVMPGVLILEAMAQLSGVMLLAGSDNQGKIAYLISVDGVKFRRAVTPGDQLRIEVTSKKAIRKTRGHCEAHATVDGKTIATATLKFALVDDNRGL